MVLATSEIATCAIGPFNRRGRFFYLAEQALQGLAEGSILLEVARLARTFVARPAYWSSDLVDAASQSATFLPN